MEIIYRPKDAQDAIRVILACRHHGVNPQFVRRWLLSLPADYQQAIRAHFEPSLHAVEEASERFRELVEETMTEKLEPNCYIIRCPNGWFSNWATPDALPPRVPAVVAMLPHAKRMQEQEAREIARELSKIQVVEVHWVNWDGKFIWFPTGNEALELRPNHNTEGRPIEPSEKRW